MAPNIGEPVVFVDDRGVEHHGLVTDVHPGMSTGADTPDGINVVYVSEDEERRDSWGRQLRRDSSVVHESAQPAGGMYWREP